MYQLLLTMSYGGTWSPDEVTGTCGRVTLIASMHGDFWVQWQFAVPPTHSPSFVQRVCSGRVLIKTHGSLALWCLESSCVPRHVSFPETHGFFSPLFPSLVSTSGKWNKWKAPNTLLMSTNWCVCWWDLQKGQAGKGPSNTDSFFLLTAGPQGGSKCWYLGTACVPVPWAGCLLQTKAIGHVLS